MPHFSTGRNAAARKLIRRIALTENVYQVSMTEDENGNPFSLENGFQLLFSGKHIIPDMSRQNMTIQINNITISNPGWIFDESTQSYVGNFVNYQSGLLAGRFVVPSGRNYSKWELTQHRVNGEYFGKMFASYATAETITGAPPIPTSTVRTVSMTTPTPIGPVTSVDVYAFSTTESIGADSVIELWEV